MKKIMLFGMGENAKRYVDEYIEILKSIEYEIIAFLDNDKDKEAKEYHGIRCLKPSKLKEANNYDYDEIIITVRGENMFNAIFEQLTYELSVPRHKIFPEFRFIELKQAVVRKKRQNLPHTRESRFYDCFMFNNELDILEIRLEMLDRFVDQFVLVEMPMTLKGKEKPCYFELNKKRYKKYLDKIIYIRPELPVITEETGEWDIEFYQRNSIMKGLKSCEPDDLIIISDVDEIVNPEILERVKENQERQRHDILTDILETKAVVCEMELFYYYFNLKFRKCLGGSTLVKFKNMLEPQEHRNIIQDVMYLPKGGWHFSYFGDSEFIRNKIASTVDGRDVAVEIIQQCLKEGTDLYGRTGEMFQMEFIGKSEISINNIDYLINKYPQYYYVNNRENGGE